MAQEKVRVFRNLRDRYDEGGRNFYEVYVDMSLAGHVYTWKDEDEKAYHIRQFVQNSHSLGEKTKPIGVTSFREGAERVAKRKALELGNRIAYRNGLKFEDLSKEEKDIAWKKCFNSLKGGSNEEVIKMRFIPKEDKKNQLRHLGVFRKKGIEYQHDHDTTDTYVIFSVSNKEREGYNPNRENDEFYAVEVAQGGAYKIIHRGLNYKERYAGGTLGGGGFMPVIKEVGYAPSKNLAERLVQEKVFKKAEELARNSRHLPVEDYTEEASISSIAMTQPGNNFEKIQAKDAKQYKKARKNGLYYTPVLN
jgi:hypothetical protein